MAKSSPGTFPAILSDAACYRLTPILGPFFLLNAALIGFFGFAAIYHLILWWSSRREILLAVFSADCALRAAFCGVRLPMAMMASIAEAQKSQEVRFGFGILILTTWVWSISLISGVRQRAFLWTFTGICLAVCFTHVVVVPLNADVLSVQSYELPWGETISNPQLGPQHWWYLPVNVIAVVVQVYGIYCGCHLWRRDRIAGLMILLSTGAIFALHVAHALKVFQIVDLPFLWVVGHVVWAGMICLIIARRAHQMRDQLAASESSLRVSHQRLEALSRQLISTQETERRQLARELHDEIGQVLTAIKINLRHSQRDAQSDLVSQLDENIGMVDRAIVQVRNLSLSLRPPQLDELGLIAALHWLTKHQARLGDFQDQLDVDLGHAQIPAEMEIVCFRIAQEALTNAVRHGQPKNVQLSLSVKEAMLSLTIQDDGIGFNLEDSRIRAAKGEHFGLISMQERGSLVGGQVQVQSSPGQGTRIQFRVRLNAAVGFNDAAVAS